MKNDPSHAALREADNLGHEARAGRGDHAVLRLWLRLLASTTQIENEVRRLLRERFGISLARFDYMAQLDRAKGGMKMSELSRLLMVTGGNVTTIVDQLEKEALVERLAEPADRRASRIRLTRLGERTFCEMAQAHEEWVIEMLAGLSRKEHEELLKLLAKLKQSTVEVTA